ncbi:hypothetical protein SPFM12_00076 [Salmonella phage SPFM12]|nr:hypothetical protein SPFM12_00076 [Salmonella phage SPFM12]
MSPQDISRDLSRQIKSLIRSYFIRPTLHDIPSGIYLDPGSRNNYAEAKGWRTPMAAPLCEEMFVADVNAYAYYVYLYAKSLEHPPVYAGGNSPEAKKLAGKAIRHVDPDYSSTGDWPFRPLAYMKLFLVAILVLLLTGCPGSQEANDFRQEIISTLNNP